MGKKTQDLGSSTDKKGQPSCFNFCFSVLGISYPFLGNQVLHEKKTISLCPLCKFNDVIYDYKTGNVLRGYLKKANRG